MFVQLEPIRGRERALINPSLVSREGPGPRTRVEEPALLQEATPQSLAPCLVAPQIRGLDLWDLAPPWHGCARALCGLVEMCQGRKEGALVDPRASPTCSPPLP